MQYTKGIRLFSEYIERWSEPANQRGEWGSQLFKQWFPYSEVALWGGAAPSSEEAREIVERYLVEHDDLNRQIQREDVEAIKRFINMRFEPYGNRVAGMSLPVANLGAALKHIGFQVVRSGRSGSGQVIITRRERDEAVEPEGTEIDL